MEIGRAEDIGAVLRRARVSKGMSQQQLATTLGVTRQWVASVEAGAPTARLGLVIDALRCVDVLLETRADESQVILDAVPGFRP
ncbi:helix-turn-helix transcriptional regulator [Tessaracoccus caeni]|uniref:helix-turn-helix transcriptional regulator n=1 Tax=Tessaracoccus caeni TaxID=3031239 RepID=UPI0023DBB477|nr:helix-turn-helix transcriptional regulator [Tessaracoccus caeni]MDF1489515.1 helix-turn-helix transcriptional regulator [Tessaracoccus caeni]